MMKVKCQTTESKGSVVDTKKAKTQIQDSIKHK